MDSSAVVSYADSTDAGMQVPKQLPEPTGFRLLVAPMKVDKKTSGGIFLTDERRDKETDASVVYCVLKVGPDAYDDIRKFPNGPWCKEGDWVVLPSYAGVKVMVNGMQFRIINDDTVQAVVRDPRGIGRA